LIQCALDKFEGDDLQIIVDRQGGRIHYRKHLQRMFNGMELKILRESPSDSSYEMRAGSKSMRLHFAVGADERFLPVSLASMMSKYLRELLVHNMNRYFADFHSDLRPTAGYWKDGLRFIEDLKTNIPDLKVDMDRLVRSR
jgi:ribonuclease HII